MNMVVAAITLWSMFSLWLLTPFAGLPPLVARVALTLLAAELVALLTWSYGAERCDTPNCAPLAQAAGVAARTDLPALAGLLIVALLLRARRGQPAA